MRFAFLLRNNIGGTSMTAQTQIKDIMSKKLKTCHKETTIQDVARMMADMDCGAIPVVDSSKTLRPLGIITDRDIVSRTIAKGIDPMGRTAGDCMTKNCYTITEDTSIANCLKEMEEKQVRRIVVVDNAGRCRGVVSQADIARHASDGRIAKLLRMISQPARGRRRAAA